MRQLYSARNGLEAHELRLLLESHGIVANVIGDTNAFESIGGLTPTSAPRVFVAEVDFDRAAQLLDDFEERTARPAASDPWTCSCGQQVPAEFELCWKCNAPRGDAASDLPRLDIVQPVATVTAPAELVAQADALVLQTARRSSRELWLEVLVVLAVAWFPNFAGAALFDPAVGRSAERSFAERSTFYFVEFTSEIVVILYVIYRSGEPWSMFGIRRIRPIADPAMAALVWFTTIIVLAIIRTLAVDMFGYARVAGERSAEGWHLNPTTSVDLVLLVLLGLMTGFCEELGMRGYLIPRLEQLLKSPTQSVLISALLFASYHIYQGFTNAFWIFVLGVVFGFVFCGIRRLWPLVIAHAAMDIIAMWPRG